MSSNKEVFKDYNLTKEEIFEVAMMFIDNQIEIHKNLAEEALHDNNYGWAADYFKDTQVLLTIKIMEDKLYYRFIEE